MGWFTKTTAGYWHFLSTYLKDNVDDFCFNRFNNLWCQQDGAPRHNAKRVSDYLSEMLNEQLQTMETSTGTLTRFLPLDYYLLRTMKDIIYKCVPTLRTSSMSKFIFLFLKI